MRFYNYLSLCYKADKYEFVWRVYRENTGSNCIISLVLESQFIEEGLTTSH